jgi:hypothetical protein
MGLFNRNEQEKGAAPVTAASTTTPPLSPPRQQAGDKSVYSETTKSTKSPYHHPDDDAIHEDTEDDFDEEEAHKPTEWDEGGASHCGYSDMVHETLMKVGGSVHNVVGGPPHFLETRMHIVANWFQEMSYAVRDFMRGESKMTEDLADVMNSVMQEDSQDEGDAHPADAPQTPAVTAS